MKYLCLLALGFSSGLLQASDFQEKSWLAFGDMRGYFEPCGCDPEADLGGIMRLDVFMQRERAFNQDLLLFSLGNNISTDSKNEAYKSPYILQGNAALKPSAYLVNRLEWQQRKILPKYQLPYVISNQRRPTFPMLQSRNRTYIYGYYYESSRREHLAEFDKILLNKWQSMAKDASFHKVLLFAGSDKALQAIVKTGFFDQIIRSNAAAMAKIVGPEEKEDPRLLKQAYKNVRMVPLGGQGVLRGGRLTMTEAKSVTELLQGETPKIVPSKDMFVAPQTLVTWLDKSYSLGSSQSKLYSQYTAASKAQFEKLSASRVSFLKDTPFIGSEACQSCHPQAFKKWKNSGHANAFATLKEKNKHKDPNCVSCHVLGFSEKGGYVSEKHSPQFKNVTCENCHGPRKAHATGGSVSPAVAKLWKKNNSCESCHNGTHSSNFEFKKYWPSISHGLK